MEEQPLPVSALPAMMYDADGTIPPWAGQEKGEPFDVREFLESRAAPADNAAPLYFAALAEVSADMRAGPNAPAWWPWKGPTPTRVRELMVKIDDLAQPDKLRANAFPPAEIENVLGMARRALEKLDQAQQKPRCVFVSGTNIDSFLPYAQASRAFARLAMIQLYHARLKGDFDQAELVIRRTLRLARDLRPRGFIVTQLVSFALERLVLSAMGDFTLTQEGLGTRECDRLLALLAEHRRDPLSLVEEALRMEYIMVRNTLEDLRTGRRSAEEFARQHGTEAAKYADLAAEIHHTDWEREVNVCNRFFAGALAAARHPIHEVLATEPRADEADRIRAKGGVVTAELFPPIETFFPGVARHEALVAGTQCLVAVRRYVLVHGEPPPDLAEATRDAGLSCVPTDPFSGQPMRYKVVNGKPVVYSVGQNLTDDGGTAESFDTRPPSGDILYEMGE